MNKTKGCLIANFATVPLSVHNKPYTNWELDIMSNAKTKLGITKYSIVTNSNDSVTLRLMTEHDLAMLYEWLNRSHIV
ncbi:hypothetical protein ACVWDX_28030, partial [Escherichia coli]|nr:hypothetical protein [Klebsiella oxytoca]MDM4181533.1 hypothetical protein [Klebsiella oxytoca]MDM4199595.1 hypothetical protein [Klebsiella oxytoca]MDM4311612.1 hypothetical protein [Klebsiella oxytoca]MDM4395500.1 hypothetical protein [Klebsiella oxytoca]